MVEPAATFGGSERWESGAARFGAVVGRLGMQLTEGRAYAVDAGTHLVALVAEQHFPGEIMSTQTSASGPVSADSCVGTQLRAIAPLD